MAWHDSIDHPSSLFTMFKPERPLIEIPRAHHSHLDPLRTPEDSPVRHQHAPWFATQQLSQIDDVYQFSPFHDDHNRFPDVEDADWAMGMVSPPSPSRRSSLELELLPEEPPSAYDQIDLDDPPTLSPPSPSRRTLTLLPHGDAEIGLEWSRTEAPVLFDSDDCPELSPPSPVQRSGALPPIESESQPLFIQEPEPLFVETTLHFGGTPPSPQHTHASPLDTRLHAEHCALLSLFDRTIHAENTSRARNQALRSRERDIGRAVAALRAAAATSTEAIAADTSTFPPPVPSATDTTSVLHAYHAAATRVMLERTEEKRRRKKDKERLKELRVLLGTGVDALLGVRPEELCSSAEHSSDVTMDSPPSGGFGSRCGPVTEGLGLALNVAPALPSPEERYRALAERTHAMRRLVARMTMRRRDLGMRSLIEAGNMGEAEETNGTKKRGSSRLIDVHSEDEDITPDVEGYPCRYLQNGVLNEDGL